MAQKYREHCICSLFYENQDLRDLICPKIRRKRAKIGENRKFKKVNDLQARLSKLSGRGQHRDLILVEQVLKGNEKIADKKRSRSSFGMSIDFLKNLVEQENHFEPDFYRINSAPDMGIHDP